MHRTQLRTRFGTQSGIRLAGSIFILLAALVMAAASAAEPRGEGRHRGPGHGPERFLEEHAERLDLDEETRAALRAILDGSKSSAQKPREELHQARRRLHNLLAEETPDEAAVMKQAERIGALETERHKHRLATMMRIRALLTPEQRAELAELREEKRSHWSHVRDHGLSEACEGDVEEFCSDARWPGSRRHCMRRHRDELSEECREALESRRSFRHGRHHRPDDERGVDSPLAGP